MRDSGNFLYDLEWKFEILIFYHISFQIFFFHLELWQILLFFCHGSSHTHSQRGCSFALSWKCKILYFNSERCRRALSSSSLQPEQFKPNTQSATADPIRHLVEAEFCIVSPCGDPKYFMIELLFYIKKFLLHSPLLFFFPPIFPLFFCYFYYPLLQPFFFCPDFSSAVYPVFKQGNHKIKL